MKKKINKVIALGICMVMLFSAGVFAEEGAVIASENKEVVPNVIVQDEVTAKESQKVEDKVAEVKEDINQTVVEIVPEVSLEKPEEKLEEKLIEEPEKLIESEIPEVEVQEEAIEAEAAPILMRGPAGPLKSLYPVKVSGTVGGNLNHESVICGERAGITGVYGKETVNRYDRNEPLSVSVYREGYMGNMLKVEIYATNGAKATGGTPYNYVLGPDGGATAWYTDYTIENIDKDASQVDFVIKGQYMYPMGGIGTFLRTVTINLADDRNAPPENVDFIYDRMLREDAYRLWGVDERMEYRKLSDTSWTSCASNQDIYIPIPANNETYLVRYKASGDSPESQYKEITLRKKPGAPGVGFDIHGEKITSLSLDMEYDINDSGKFIPVTQEMITNGISDIIDTIPAEKAWTMKFRKSAGVMPASEIKEVKIFGRTEFPANMTFTPNNYTFTNVPSNTRYSFDGISWNSTSAGLCNLERYASGDSEKEVYFKIIERANYCSASKIKSYKLPKLSESPKNIKIDYYAETIVGLNPNVKYQYALSADATNWNYLTVSNLAIQLKPFITNYDKTIYIKEIKDGSTPSVPVKLVIPKRQSCAQDIAFVYNDANNYGKPTLKNVNSDIEYRLSTSTKWETAKEGTTFETPPANKNYIFRVKAKEGQFISNERPITMYTNGSCYGPTYNNITEDLGSLTKILEWKMESDANYQPYTLNSYNMNMSKVVDAIPSGKTVKVYVRIMTTEKQPHSKDKILTIYSRLPEPTTVSFDKNTKSLVGVNINMQYRKVGEVNWRIINNTSMNLSSLIGSSTDVKVEVRMKPTPSNSASKIKVINCY